MKIQVGDKVLAKRNISPKSDGRFTMKQDVIGVIAIIPKHRKFAVIDTGFYRECFPLNQLIYMKDR